MGQKVNPIGFRLGVYRNWDARWYADKEYTKLLHEDIAMRRLIGSRLRNAGLARIETERSANQLTVIIQTAKPGIVIGKQGASVDALRDELERISGKKVRVTIHEIKTPELDATLVAENVASQLEKRIAFRRALKQTLMRSMRAGAKGVKIQVSGLARRLRDVAPASGIATAACRSTRCARTSTTARPKHGPRSVASASSAGSTSATM